jgi:hypothetical protein
MLVFKIGDQNFTFLKIGESKVHLSHKFFSVPFKLIFLIPQVILINPKIYIQC